MHGKIHPHWFLPINYFPCKYYIRAYKSDFDHTWYVKYDTESEEVPVETDGQTKMIPAVIPADPTKFHNINQDELIALQFNARVSSFYLIESVYTNDTPADPTGPELIFKRKNKIICHYPDDFDAPVAVAKAEHEIKENVVDLILVDNVDSHGYSEHIRSVIYGTKVYMGRRVRHYMTIDKSFYDEEGKHIGRIYTDYHHPFKVILDPHNFAEKHLGITRQNYDFALVKYIEWSHRYGNPPKMITKRHKAIISDVGYYPYGWFEEKREYWTLLSSKHRERICIQYHSQSKYHADYYGLAVSEIQYLKLKGD